jgi:glucose-1-phosphate adenylyltransferase
MKNPKILAFVMAGGEGSRLSPLTIRESKPSIPFGGRFRIVDFVLSNLLNSDIQSIYLLVQYKSQSLIEHIRKSWVMSPMNANQFVTIVPPQMMKGEDWFQGTADAVYQNLNLIQQHDPDLILVFGADHIYRMDLKQMIDFHMEREAEISVAALPVPLDEAKGFGIIATESDGKICEFQEKPDNPSPMPTDPTRAYASMGNYLFNAKMLVNILQEGKDRGEHDFGNHVLPRVMKSNRLYAYDFATNQVPGIRSYEEPAYWRDVGTLDAYFNAHQDILGFHPRLNLFNSQWPVFSSNYQGPVVKIVSGSMENSIVGAGTLINGAAVRNSVVRREVFLEEDVELEDCIIQDYVHIKRGARLRRAIVGRYNVIEAGAEIGHDPEADGQIFHRTESGIVVVPPGEPRFSMSSFMEGA